MSDVDGELRELLRRKAEEARLEPAAPAPVLRRARRRRIGNAVVAGLTTAAVVAGAFVGLRAALQEPVHKRSGIAAAPTTHQVWFTMNGRLFVTYGETQDTPEAVMQALLDGPTPVEAGATVGSSIPDVTELRSLSVENGLARVELSPPLGSALGEAQVVFTLTQFPSIQRVQFQVPAAQGGNAQPGSLTRDDLASNLPAILLEHPSIDDTVSSPVTISGTANVFEANVSIRIIAGEGTVIADTYATATCGTGCRGTYSKDVSYTLDQRQTGVIEVFEASAQNGQPTNVVRIPVTLEPSVSSSPLPTTWDGVWRPDYTTAGRVAGADPQTAAVAFAQDVLGWDPQKVHIEERNAGPNPEVDLWNTDMTTTFTRDVAEILVMKQVGTEWTVWQAESGLFDVTCPSPRADLLATEVNSAIAPTEICGSFTQAPAGWIVRATQEYSDSSLQPSEAQATADIPVNGRDFHGSIPLTATYGGADVAVMIRVYSGSGATLGVWARRYTTTQVTGPSSTP